LDGGEKGGYGGGLGDLAEGRHRRWAVEEEEGAEPCAWRGGGKRMKGKRYAQK